ncbi:MAG: hypothetical protein FH758_12735 [Firmicutes bacterium]|nr:hypothetical protein [Bacillota bacterium]
MNIDKNEVLRYLGYKQGKTKISSSMLEKIDYYISLGITLAEPNTCYRILNKINFKPKGVELPEVELVLPGQDISNHLKNCNKVCLVATTIGRQLEDKVSELFNHEEYAGGTILDAVGSDAVEKAADQLQEELKLKAKKQGYHLTWRFASGYGDLPLDINSKLASVVSANSIGITVTESNMLLPQKSILGIVGFSATETDTPLADKCAYCNAVDCAYRNRSDKCAKHNGKD